MTKIKSLGKWKTSKSSPIKKFTSQLSIYLKVLNTTKLSNSFYGQTSLNNTIFSVLILGVKIFVVGWRNALLDSSYLYIPIWYKLISFYFLLNLTIYRMGNAPNILCPIWKEQKQSQSYFISYCKLSKITLGLSVN